MKAIMRSLSPKDCNRIAHGEKTIDVVKIKPIAEPPFKVYIYCTKNGEALYYLGKTDNMFDTPKQWNGKVIGEFVCESVDEYIFGNYEERYSITDARLAKTCLNHPILINYGKGKPLYGLHISQLKIYDEPKELSEFRKPCIYHHYCCAWCRFGNIILSDDEEEFALYHGGSYETFDTVCCNYVKRPPQSWCYVEEQEE